MRSGEELMQRDKHELSERRGRLKRDGAKPSLLVKRENAADLIEITNHPFDPVLSESASQLRGGAAEPTP
jgi:hypothetical protein